jgi:uncharacterized membrane protein YphA (DoxX/SURF4 family)
LTPLDRPAWKTTASWSAAIFLAAVFAASGIWKITDAQSAAIRMTQVQVPQALSLAAALLVGISETVAGVLIFVPRFRRWGALLAFALLLLFMAYVGFRYNALAGADCSCFPWVKRIVGPGFFVGDALMATLAVIAGAWSRPPSGFRSAMVVLGAVIVYALISYGASAARLITPRAPASVAVAGQPYSLQQGRIFVFFFHPACMHCYQSAQLLAQARWHGVRVLAVPVENPQYAPQFLAETGLSAVLTSDFQKLKDALGYSGYPSGVALENGRERGRLLKFEDGEPLTSLRKLGFVD